MFRNLSNHSSSVFEPRAPLRVNEIQELDIESALLTTYVTTPIQTEQKLADNTQVTVRMNKITKICKFTPKSLFTLKFLTFNTEICSKNDLEII